MESDDFHRQAWLLWQELQDLSDRIWNAHESGFIEFIEQELEVDAMEEEANDAWAAHFEQEGFFDQP